MRAQYVLLLVYWVSGSGVVWVEAQNNTCGQAPEDCDKVSDSTSQFLQCAGVPSGPLADPQHLHNLLRLVDATLDVYSFMRSALSQGPALELWAGIEVTPQGLVSEADVLKVWLEVKMKPLLSSVSHQFLRCLGNKNLSCEAYQTVVRELSHHFSAMDSSRQKWIYMFFMYPFLSDNRTAGCMHLSNSSEDWLMKNFGSFSVKATMKDLSSLNMVFSGLEVLHLLTPEQRAELLLQPGVAGLDDGALSLVFNSLLQSLMPGRPTPPPTTTDGATMAAPAASYAYNKSLGEYMATVGPYHTTQYYLPPRMDPVREMANGFMTFLKPAGSFARHLIDFTHQHNLTTMRSATLIQSVLNWTLAELAAPYKQKNHIAQNEMTFDPLDVSDWFQHVVVPVLRRYLPQDQTEIPENITAVFHNLFHIQNGLDYKEKEETDVDSDICSVSLDKTSCALTDAVEEVARVMHCAVKTNLSLTEETLMQLVMELSSPLNSLMRQLMNMNFSSPDSPFFGILDKLVPGPLTQENLDDVTFIQLWFQIKLRPLLPSMTPEYLSCLSAKRFSCEAYQALVQALGDHMTDMHEGGPEMVLQNFLIPYLSNPNTSDPGCVGSAENSTDWMEKNMGRFSPLATLVDMYSLNPHFSAMEVMARLSPRQMAELMVAPLPRLPPKAEVVERVFGHLLMDPEERDLPDVLTHLVRLSHNMVMDCESYQIIVEKLYDVLWSVPRMMEPAIWAAIHNLRQPPDCALPVYAECPVIQYNESRVCAGVNSTELQHHLVAGHVPCEYTLTEYACSQLTGFTAQHLTHLLVCKLSSNMTYSTETWKLLLTKTSAVLDEVLIIFSHMVSNMSLTIGGPSVTSILDVLGEIRLDSFDQEGWSNIAFVSALFGESLRPFLPFASGSLLQCVSKKNFTCETYQDVVQEFSQQFDHIPKAHKEFFVDIFIKPFLTKNTTDSACYSNDSVGWLVTNFGRFSILVSLQDLFSLNKLFDPMSALDHLSPLQTAELMVHRFPGLPAQVEVINAVFDHMTSNGQKLPEVLHHLVALSKQVVIPCESYETLFERLYQILPYEPREIEPIIWATIDDLMQTSPRDCLPMDLTCPITPFNDTRVCHGIDSSALQSHLGTGSGMTVCNFSVEQYACAHLGNFSAGELVDLLQCKLSSNMTYSKETWKLLLTKTSAVLDEALGILSNMSVTCSGPAVPLVLDVIREMRLDLREVGVISAWFSGHIRPFLPSASGVFLNCLSGRNLSCASYQHVLYQFSNVFSHMDDGHRQMVSKYFIHPFLSRNSTGACASNNSADWLKKNFGPFSVFTPVPQLLSLNPQFSPLEVLDVLSPGQLTELMVAPLPGLSDKGDVINRVFDFLAAAPEDRKLPEVLQHLVTLSGQPGSIPCSSYRVLFKRMDQLIPVVSVLLEMSITSAKTAFLTTAPPGCVIYSGECNVTPINETDICLSINSTALQHLLDSQQVSRSLCAFSIPQYACAELSALTAEDLVTLFTCKMSEDHPKQTWKLFITKANHILGHALDLFNSMTLTDSPAVSHILDAIGEVSFSSFSTEHVRDVAYVKRWFQTRLRPFLPFVTAPFLSCLATKNFSCHTYQSVVQAMGNDHGKMANSTQIKVYTDFIEVFLSDKADSGCTAGVVNTADWLEKNFGPFSAAASVVDLQRLHGNFSLMEALPRLTLGQLLEASVTPGLLSSPAETTTLLQHVPDPLLASYFTSLAPAAQVISIAAPIRSAMLQQVFDRANLSESSVPDNEVLVWLNDRLAFLLPDLSPTHVGPYFDIIRLRQCGTSQQAVALLNSTLATLPDDTQTLVHSHIIRLLTEPSPLRCYVNGSFYSFLETTFMGFQFPNLTTFLALLPAGRTQQLVNSMPPAHLGSFLRRPGTVDDTTKLCQIFDAYTQTPQFLATVNVPEAIQPSILPCVWPQALASSSAAEADLWFDTGLSRYLRYLNKNLISYSALRNAHCLAFRKFVIVIGNHTYSSSDFTEKDVYSTIHSYLSTGPKPRCYNSSLPQLASTSWFVDYVGIFIQFITLEDFNAFGGASLQPFTTNLANLQLFNQTALPPNVSSFYVELLYQQDPTFNPIHLSLVFRCFAPAVAFANLTLDETMALSAALSDTCGQIDQDVSAALSSNVETISPASISMLGNSSTGLSTGQLSGASPTAIFSSLSVLSTVVGWNHGQASMLVRKLVSSGSFTIGSSNDLQKLGSLISGVPSSTINGISTSEILIASRSQEVVSNVMAAPVIVQQAFVSKIISADTSVGSILANVPSELSTQIPRNYLQSFSQTADVVVKLNQKQWTQSQAVLVFDTVAAGMDNSSEISFQVLQGFTCTRVESLTKAKVKSLIKGCRRRKNLKLTLKQTQLTCMYYYLRDEADATDYSLFPADVLLYYDYSKVTNCESYFTELGYADFNVLSDAYESRKTTLVANAKACLGITGTSISAENVNILGNMVCILDGSYIQNSDPSILENLKGCDDLTDSLVSGMETLLLSGNTTYGVPSAWTEQTLEDLGILPLYFTSNIWNEVPKKVGQKFLKKTFMKQLKNGDVPRRKIGKLKSAFRSAHRSKRAATTECTVGTITQVQIHGDTFPIDYDTTQFDACLSIATLKDNLAAITDKADEESYREIILKKLNQAYPEGISDDVVQMLGPASRGASVDDISKWNVTKIDTLSILMKSSDGEWSNNQTKAIMARYLAARNSIDSSALNAVGGSGLCALDSSVLEGISSNSLRQADALTISSCSLAKKKSLFPIAQAAFISQKITKRATTTVTATQYQLIESYLGGATESFVQTLASSNIGMDISTFLGLDQSVIKTLSVSDVRSLLGSTNVNDLRTYSSNGIIQDWISRQYQSDLNTLNLGLTGGRSTPSATTTTTTVNGNAAATTRTVPTSTTTTTTTKTTTTTTTTTATTKRPTTASGGANVKPIHGLHCLLLAIVASALCLLQ
ncbi:hypothetical protein ACEWY4_017578 [Coilia grayii]|uniref:Uncharacterized protein n=1 Tax=Coilia grayii TaxID=363190 RepID=A0ABD1JHH5_9TELE